MFTTKKLNVIAPKPSRLIQGAYLRKPPVARACR